MSEHKGDLFFEKSDELVRAIWRSPTVPTDILLAAVNASGYETHPTIRETFNNFAATIAINLNKPAGELVAVQHIPLAQPTSAEFDRRHFPCWRCEDLCVALATEICSRRCLRTGCRDFAARSRRRG